MLIGLVALLGLAAFGVAVHRGERDLSLSNRLSSSSFTALFAAYSGLACGPILAAWLQSWPLALPAVPSLVVGATCAAAGAWLHILSRIEFKSFRLTWGLALNRLVMTGPYRFSRNPQVAGLTLFLFGVALIGRSGTALCLVSVFWACSRAWIAIEERALLRSFGESYRRYQALVPRFIGIPRLSRPLGQASSE